MLTKFQGTIIFGGGPVVIPLLREYVVQPGWVSPRDFLIGLAIIQAFPGPNFNFAVYLGALSLPGSRIAGGLLGYGAIFLPGLAIKTGVLPLWRTFRSKRYIHSFLRGVNASAVGLVYTAIYRLWEIGFISETQNTGQSLGREPWWVVCAAVSYAGCAWFRVPAPAAIACGAVMGLIWFGVTA